MNIGLVKHGFRVMASWSLKKMLKLFILSFQTGVAEGRLLGNYFPSPCLTGPVYHDFLRNLHPQLLQIRVCRLLRLIFGSCIMGAPPHFSSCSSGILERVSGTIDKRRWTYRMACSFPWFKILWLYIWGQLKSISYTTDVRDVRLIWLVRHLGFSTESTSRCSNVQPPALKLKVDPSNTFLNN
jgi:hypothetical protein